MGYVIKTARSMHEIEGVLSTSGNFGLERPTNRLNVDFKRYASVSQAVGGRDPLVVTILHDEEVVGLLLGWIGDFATKAGFGYLELNLPRRKVFLIEYGGVLLSAGHELNFQAALAGVFHNTRCEVIAFDHAPEEIFNRCGSRPKIVCNREPHWRTDAAGSIDALYCRLSSKHRGNIKRAVRNIEGNPSYSTRVCQGIEQLDRFISDAREVSKKTYQYALGAGLNDIGTIGILYAEALNNGWLDFSVAYFNDKPVAFQVGYKYGDVYYLDALGYDPDEKKSNIGTVLFFQRFEALCSEGRIKWMDYGFGDADYKRSYGNESWAEVSFEVITPRFKPVLVALLKATIIKANNVVKEAAHRTGLARRIKRVWRDGLQRKA